MPRRNESGPGKGGSSRDGGGRSNSGRGRSSGKSFRKSEQEDIRPLSKGKSFGNKKKFSSTSPARGERKSKPGGKSFRKSDTGSSRSTSSKPFDRRSKFSEGVRSEGKQGYSRPYTRSAPESEDKGLSKRSRFAPPSTLKGETSFSGRAGSRKGTDKKPFSGKSDAPKFQSRNKPRFSDSGGEQPRKERGESFGKPYKKTYRARPNRERSADTRGRGVAVDPTAPKSDKIRLNKFIANSGISSRREADELITLGLISVNGKVVSELGYKVNPGDEVRYENKVLRAEKPVYILMNKPKGFLTTTDDPQERKTVMHIIGSAVKERIYPVGRLDRNTTGLLLLTNDGDLADKLMHPSFNVKKVYKVELDKPLTKADLQSILDGVHLEEGRAEVDDLAIVSDDGRTVGIELHIGWNRVVRRIFENVGYEVIKLDRSVYAGLDKKELGRGQWRFLSKEEIIHLKHFK
ncbi:MAG: pseudouridine synthase [Cyclobacteriaceae bacterium]